MEIRTACGQKPVLLAQIEELFFLRLIGTLMINFDTVDLTL